MHHMKSFRFSARQNNRKLRTNWEAKVIRKIWLEKFSTTLRYLRFRNWASLMQILPTIKISQTVQVNYLAKRQWNKQQFILLLSIMSLCKIGRDNWKPRGKKRKRILKFLKLMIKEKILWIKEANQSLSKSKKTYKSKISWNIVHLLL